MNANQPAETASVRTACAATAIIVTFERAPQLMRTLQMVVEQSVPPQHVIVVDNAADRDVAAMIESTFPDVTYAAAPANAGPAGGFNLGLRTACSSHAADWYWLLDDDSPPPPRRSNRPSVWRMITAPPSVPSASGGVMSAVAAFDTIFASVP